MHRDPRRLKIAYIGGGSRSWARVLMSDLALCPEIGGEVHLFDIDAQAAQLNAALGEWIQQLPVANSTWRYRPVDRLELALADADFVIISILPGTFGMMAHEIAIAEKYGMYFPVGDTVGVPGLTRGLRSAIIFERFANAISQQCPEAWIINYTNPMSICTRTLTRVQPDLKVLGCCHEVFGTQEMLAEIVRDHLRLPDPPSRQHIKVNILGINHCTWIDQAMYQEVDVLEVLRDYLQRPGVVRTYTKAEVEQKQNWFVDHYQIKFELFRRHGILPAAGDRHLVEFVPGFIHSDEELFRWGLIRTPVSYRIRKWEADTQAVHDIMDGKMPFTPKTSDEAIVPIMKALLGVADFVTNINFKNIGQVANLPQDAVVETNAWIGPNQVQPIAAGALPPSVHTLVRTHVANQEMIIDAALERNAEQAFRAILNDPNTNIPVHAARSMFNEIGLPDGFW